MSEKRDLMSEIRAELPSLTTKLRAIGDLALSDTERFIRNTSKDICAEIGTSEPTLIRFCRHFGFAGLSDFRIELALSLARQPRGAGFVEPLAVDRRRTNLTQKQKIAERAVPLVEGDAAILIDNGSTAEFFAGALGELEPLTIMTTGLVVAQNAMQHRHHTVMLTGGRIRPNALSLTGRLVEDSLKEYRFDTFVMGADSVDAQLGLSTFREDEAAHNRAMVDAAARVIVLADSTKFSKPALHKICDIPCVSTLVTDLPDDDPNVAALRQRGLEVILVS
ncbi:transcriptional regulator [Marivivens aquimaris]|uniref:transcriptional regulator n=1 Tax=Marivivens aquimaris TaxID=2774876 RepID=UPI0018807E80|nr:transcriptional regulator [Marivivens aquimaris]